MNYFIYKTNDQDATLGYYAAWLKHKDDITYIPVKSGDNFPGIFVDNTSKIYIQSYTYPTEVLKNIPNVIIFEDCIKAWEYFHHDTPMPFIFELTQDIYLTNREYVDSYWLKEYFQAYNTYNNVENIHELIEHPDYLKEALYRGRVVYEAKQTKIKTFDRYKVIDLHGYKAAIYNMTDDVNIIAEGVLLKDKNIDLVISFIIRPNLDLILSFRSLYMDVTEIAIKYNGLGHKTSAGAIIQYPESIEQLKKFIGVV